MYRMDNQHDPSHAWIELDDGRAVLIRRAGATDDEALARLGGPSFQVVYKKGGVSPGVPRREMFVALTLDGEVVGAAWLEIGEHDPIHGQLRLALEPAWRHLGVEAALAKRTAESAREHGCTRVTAYVPYISSDVFASLRAARMNVRSCLSLGWVAEVELDVL